jgi:hypothetical protein
VEKYPGTVASAVYSNPANIKVELGNGWLIRPSFITIDEMKACQLTGIQIQQKKILYLFKLDMVNDLVNQYSKYQTLVNIYLKSKH